MELKGQRVALLAEDSYEDLELWYPKLRLTEAGAQVEVVGAGEKSYRSKHGYEVKVDTQIEEAVSEYLDAIVIPGGYAPDHMRRHPKMVEFVRQGYEQGILIAAICHAGWMLA